MPLTNAELLELRRAKQLLEQPSLAMRLTNLIGTPIEAVIARLPRGATKLVNLATTKSLHAALRVALVSLRKRPRPASKRAHQLFAIGSGAAGGFFGLPALAVELPLSTTLFLRSIADIARANGEDLSRPEARLACVQVFALGGTSKHDDAAETSYFAVRTALSFAIAEAAQFIAEKGLIQEGAPLLVRLAAQIASRFGAAVSEKVAAQAVPVLGAAGGATINALFISHFQAMASGHFTVRRLERAHGAEDVRRAYVALDLRAAVPGTQILAPSSTDSRRATDPPRDA